MKKIVLTAIFISLFVIAGSSQTALRVGSNAPVFSAASMDGTQLDMNELRGSVVVLTFWSTKCYICQQEFPKMNQVVRSYESKKVVFLSLTMDNEERIETFLKSNKIASTIVPNSFGVLLQYADRDKRGYLDMGFPSYFVIDQQGVLQHRASGWDKIGQLSTTVDNLIR
jgi:cytochrome c biogenesis protein CcmG, thiol:disulfide interchange protein DsbE